MFKKRPRKDNIRRVIENVHDDDFEESGANIAAMQMLKAEQELRKKLKGQSLVDLVKGESSLLDTQTETSKRSIESMMGTQFSLKCEDGVSYVAHERIMEEFIEEKLGLKEEKKESKRNTSEDEIYKLPDNIKVLPDGGDTGNAASDTEQLGIGTGIAEVALPISFKLSNIEATELARRQLEEQRRGKPRRPQSFGAEEIKVDPSALRFQKQSQRPKVPVHMNRDQGNGGGAGEGSAGSTSIAASTVPTVNLPSHPGDSTSGHGGGHDGNHRKGYAMRNDDMMLDRFKKSQQRFGRR